MKPIFCTVKDHHDNLMNLVCLEEDCPSRGLICSFCLLTEHQSHVKSVFPLKTLVAQLNKTNNPKKQQELQNKGNEIFEKHHKIKLTFRQNIIEIKELLAKLEKDLERQIKQLDLEADLFVGDAFEKSIQILNTEELTKVLVPIADQVQIDTAIEKIEPLLKLSEGHIWLLRETEINHQATKLIKTAEILERESKYWLEKCLADLHRLENTCQEPVRQKSVKIKESQNRFGLIYEQWNLKETDAISFKSKIKQDIWLSGVGQYVITKFPEDQPLKFQVSIFDGKAIARKQMIYDDCFEVTADDPSYNHIGKLFFQKAIKLEPDHWYSIAIKPSHSCLSYYGANGKLETQEFFFEDAQFTQEFSDNSTTSNQGVIPLFYYEE